MKFLRFLPVLMLFGCTQLFSSPDARRVTLRESVSKFHNDVQWGAEVQAAEYVSTELIPNYYRKIVGDPRHVKPMEFDITDIVFDEDSQTAEVDVELSFFRVPSYIMEKKQSRQRWEFVGINAGWKLKSVHELSQGTPDVRAMPKVGEPGLP